MEWHYADDDVQRGPLSDDQLQAAYDSGMVTPSTLVWHNGMAEWRPFGEVVDLAGGATGAASPAVVTPAAAAKPQKSSSGKKKLTKKKSIRRSGTTLGAARARTGAGAAAAGSVYAAPQADLTNSRGGDIEQAEAIRRAHISHEASIRSIGVLYFLGAAGLGLAAIFMMLGIFAGGAGAEGAPAAAVAGVALVSGLFLGGFAALYVWIGILIRKLKRSSRIGVGIISGIGLLGIPIGTLINGYILYLFFSQKGSYILSPEYTEIVRQTPHVKHKTSIIIWIFVALIVLVILGGMVAAMVAG